MWRDRTRSPLAVVTLAAITHPVKTMEVMQMESEVRVSGSFRNNPQVWNDSHAAALRLSGSVAPRATDGSAVTLQQ